ncbi:MAG: tetratricopeptide repeat protein [Candidatus Thorarchaeota archaeon]|nr:tetratricopeptide repeat protein [Candidatus Thorarchaeota archaeon]
MKEFSDIVVPSKTSQIVLKTNQVAFERGEQAGFQFIIQHKEEKLQQYGSESMEYAIALNDHATFCQMRREFPLAIESLRIAISIPPTVDAMVRNRIDCLMKLGEILTEIGKVDEAEKILRSNLLERQNYYGVDHEEFALGLYELAKPLLLKKNYTHAEAIATQAVNILTKQKSPKVFRILVFKDMCVKAVHGTGKRTFNEYPTLHLCSKSTMFDYAIALAKKSEPHYTIPFLYDLRDATLVGGKASAFNLTVIALALAYNAKKLEDQAARLAVLEWNANRPEVKESKLQHADTLIELGEAFIDLRNFRAAEKALKDADDIAKIYGNDKRRARIYRHSGILYSKVGNKKKTDKMFLQALTFAGKIKDTMIFGVG